MIEDLENVERTDSGSDSGGSVGASGGSPSGGSDGSGGGSANRKRGSDSGSGGVVGGSGGNDSGSGTDSGSGSTDDDNIKSANGIIDGNSNAARPSRVERIRGNRAVRLGSAGRNSTADRGGTDSGTGTDEPILELADEPVIRLGAKKQGQPRSQVKVDNTSELKLSEMKDLISMFLDSIFEIPAVTMRQDFWRLNKEENKALTEAVAAYIKSMPKDKSNWLMKFIQENLPLVNLLMVGFFVVSGRVQNSIAIYQVTKHGKKFAEAVNVEIPKPSNGIRTPLDSVFS